MQGAIPIFKKWREICDHHTTIGETMGTSYSCKICMCENCELYNICVCRVGKKPVGLSDEDIVEFVKKVSRLGD